MRKKIMSTALTGVLLISLGLTGTYAASAVDEVAVDPQTLVFEITPVVTATGTTFMMDFPDDYWTKLIIMQLGTKGSTGLYTYKSIDHFALWTTDGMVTIKSAIKVKRGQILRIRMGGRFVKTQRIQ